ncbi:hypothetical protein NN561_016851 [Cricetulus griseus]
MAAGGGERPHPPRSSWAGRPRPPKRALTCAGRRGAASGRAAPRPAALPLRAPPRGVARAGAPPRRRGAASDCPGANSLPAPLPPPPDCEGSHPGCHSPLRFPSRIRGRDPRTDFLAHRLCSGCSLGTSPTLLGHRAPTLRRSPWYIRETCCLEQSTMMTPAPKLGVLR